MAEGMGDSNILIEYIGCDTYQLNPHSNLCMLLHYFLNSVSLIKQIYTVDDKDISQESMPLGMLD